MGLSFVASGEATHLQITARWGRYERVKIEEDEYLNKDGRYRRVWQRVPVEGMSDPLPLRASETSTWMPEPDQPDVYVQMLARRRDKQWHVTLFLVNGQREPDILKDTAWVFQPELVVEAPALGSLNGID